MGSDREQPRQAKARRRYDPAFKRMLVEQTLVPGASVALIARAHGINANQLFKWRRGQVRADGARAPAAASGVPAPWLAVDVVDEAPAAARPQPVSAGEITVECARARVHIRGAVDAATLRLVLASLAR